MRFIAWLAATAVKIFIEKISGKYFRYYRLAYSIFATLTLAWLLYFQYSFESCLLIKSNLLKYFSLIISPSAGITIMLISIKKYFHALKWTKICF